MQEKIHYYKHQYLSWFQLNKHIKLIFWNWWIKKCQLWIYDRLHSSNIHKYLLIFWAIHLIFYVQVSLSRRGKILQFLFKSAVVFCFTRCAIKRTNYLLVFLVLVSLQHRHTFNNSMKNFPTVHFYLNWTAFSTYKKT